MSRIKEESRLSFGRLAAVTHYSSSSWERFLNGKQLPSRVAVEELATVGGEEPERLIALLEEAVAQASESAPTTVDEAAQAPADIPAARPPAAPLREAARRLAPVGYMTVGALLGSLLTALLITTDQSAATAGGAVPTRSLPTEWRRVRRACRARSDLPRGTRYGGRGRGSGSWGGGWERVWWG
ncbi:helix-turn-helix domain-containing protein [Streptomyces sp. NPDC059340]|uniref:helix-turn-helix domain-containing protein n=1 Tax=Streptomyces sp. NPDC059340 TaxID=3346806 RepID=UPI0036CBE099